MISHKFNYQLNKYQVIDRMSQTAVNIFLVSLMVGLVVGETHLQLDDDYDKNLLPPRYVVFLETRILLIVTPKLFDAVALILIIFSPNGAPLDISGVMNLRNILEVEEQMQQIPLEVTLRS